MYVFFYHIADSLTKVLEKCCLNSLLANTRILFQQQNWIGCNDNQIKYKNEQNIKKKTKKTTSSPQKP